ncbi:carboxypeptidase-like regulatory domain-containing protein [Aureibacter tunicatorum]|uniref:Carboxypeptidase-like protein n=1 Tax=Aureibacter tunicatorum TaxID=866807 RepID=A0AAE3XI29_9BACT|nr:carboxypeptidase-like regulatory domain-containing protein [Aureibacter tunicatorum]MDR6238101.1 hypothetical protein [Aureibacter tunicatorum]BDD03134.1 hypothetical protein AUTU_06170 [Aureibacter tunicatorum]
MSLSLSSYSEETKEDSLISVQGRVYDAESMKPLVGVHVSASGMLKSVATDASGYFVLELNATDTLMLSHVGFQSIKIEPSRIEISDEYFLKQSIEVLTPVVVYALPENAEELKKALLSVNVPESEEEFNFKIDAKVLMSLPSDLQNAQFSERKGSGNFGLPIGGNRMAKQEKKYQAILAKEKVWEGIGKKYNKTIVREVTGVRNDSIALDVMKFCDFKKEFLERTSEYQIIVAILNCYENYQEVESFE